MCITQEEMRMKELSITFMYFAIGAVLAYLWSIAEVLWQALCSYLNDCEEDKHNEELDRLERERSEALEKTHLLNETRGKASP